MQNYEYFLKPGRYTPEKLSRKELSDYLIWYVNQIDSRVAELTPLVNRSPGFSAWEPDLSPESLNDLGRWFSAEITTRDLTLEEKSTYSNILRKFKGLIPIPEDDISPECYELILSVGMYLGRVLQNTITDLKWEIISKPRNNFDINKPVLRLGNKIPCNPIYLVYVFAKGLSHKKSATDRLHELYELWVYLLLEDPD